MIAGFTSRDAEGDGHLAEERLLRHGNPETGEICGDVEYQFPSAVVELRTRKQWRVAAPVGVGRDRLHVAPLRSGAFVQIDTQSCSGAAVGRIEYMCGERRGRHPCKIACDPSVHDGSISGPRMVHYPILFLSTCSAT